MVEVEIGGVAIYQPFGEFRRANLSCRLYGAQGQGQRQAYFDVKNAPRIGSPVVKNADKIAEIIEVDRPVSSRSIARELKIDHKRVLNNLPKVEFKKKLDVWVPHQLTPKTMMDRITICESLAKRNEIDTFLKRMVTGNEKWVTYDNIV
ncbi:histone-lysine N-methyltransferase SETMAR [Trichonephila clavipes]|nr:histone-lysine N-methyltransferase SETMAR [Trichonephila clavipes]